MSEFKPGKRKAIQVSGQSNRNPRKLRADSPAPAVLDNKDGEVQVVPDSSNDLELTVNLTAYGEPVSIGPFHGQVGIEYTVDGQHGYLWLAPDVARVIGRGLIDASGVAEHFKAAAPSSSERGDRK